MELKPEELSSNWKKLQAKLKADAGSKIPQQPKPLKRRNVNEQLPPVRSSRKRALDDASDRGHVKRTKMGGVLSTQPASHLESKPAFEGKQALSTTLPRFAENGAAEAASLPISKDEVPNCGLVTDVKAGQYIAIDCEMVGVGPPPYSASQLARVSIVNFHGALLYDSYVKPVEPVGDYRTWVSGITAANLRSARPLEEVNEALSMLMKDRILVGHAIRNDLNVILIGHPRRDLRDTAKLPSYRALNHGKTPGLKFLAKTVLGIDIQGGEHSSIEDARATMLLFKRKKDEFESEHVKRYGAAKRVVVAPRDGDVEDAPTAKKKKKKKSKTKKRTKL